MAKQQIEYQRAYNAAVKAGEEQAQAKLSGQVIDLQAKVKDFVVAFAESANLTFDISETASRKQIEAFSIKSQGSRSTSDISIFTCIEENYFDVTFTGVTPGTYDFPIYAMVDGGIVAIESDSITVGGTPTVPEPATILLMGSGLLSLIGFRKKFKK